MNTFREYPLLARSYAVVSGAAFVSKGIDTAYAAHGQRYLAAAEHHLARLHALLGHDDARWTDALDAFVELTFDVLRMQSRFYKSGVIAPFVPAQQREKVYEDAALMEGRYLQGLYLAQVFWPNHLEHFFHFHDVFLPALSDSGAVIDVGCGPGVHTAALREACPDVRILACDISPYSIEMTRKLHALCSRHGQLDTLQGDFLHADGLGSFKAAVFCEVVEHVEDPTTALLLLHESLLPGAPVFFSTATNAPFYDHVTLFTSVDQIEALVRECGFDIEDKCIVPVYQSPQPAEVLDYACVLRRRAPALRARGESL